MIARGLFVYRELTDLPGGHSFGLLDTPEGRERWWETLPFVGRGLR